MTQGAGHTPGPHDGVTSKGRHHKICGCLVTCVGVILHEPLIEYCRTHAEAPAMAALLRSLQDIAGQAMGLHAPSEWLATLREARALLARLDGTAP